MITPGGKLIGEIVCSDSFGVDIIMDKFFEKMEALDHDDDQRAILNSSHRSIHSEHGLGNGGRSFQQLAR